MPLGGSFMQFSPERAPRAQYPGYIYKNAPINVYWETTLSMIWPWALAS